MKILHLTFFSFILIFLSACNERGIPLLEPSHKTKIPNDFPLLKVSAKAAKDFEKSIEQSQVQNKPLNSVTSTIKNQKSKTIFLEDYQKNKQQSFIKTNVPQTTSLSKPKPKKKRKSHKFPSLSLLDIPIINKVIPEPSKTSKKRVKSHASNTKSNTRRLTSSSNTTRQFIGGTSMNNLDMGMIRIGRSKDYSSIILESYEWEGYKILPTTTASSSGKYIFVYEPENNRIVATLTGYNAFSALVGDQSALFNNNDIVQNIYIDRYVGNDGIKFIIQLKKRVKINIIDVDNPGRIIINLYPI
jgi:hypothetical protein